MFGGGDQTILHDKTGTLLPRVHLTFSMTDESYDAEYHLLSRAICMATIALRGHREKLPEGLRGTTYGLSPVQKVVSILNTGLPPLTAAQANKKQSLDSSPPSNIAATLAGIPGPDVLHGVVLTTSTVSIPPNSPDVGVVRVRPLKSKLTALQILEQISCRTNEQFMDDTCTILRAFQMIELPRISSTLHFGVVLVHHGHLRFADRLLKIAKLWEEHPMDILEEFSADMMFANQPFPWVVDVHVMDTVSHLQSCGVEPPLPMNGGMRYMITENDIPRWVRALTTTYRTLESTLLTEDRSEAKKSLTPTEILQATSALTVLYGLIHSGFVDCLLDDYVFEYALVDMSAYFHHCVAGPSDICYHPSLSTGPDTDNDEEMDSEDGMEGSNSNTVESISGHSIYEVDGKPELITDTTEDDIAYPENNANIYPEDVRIGGETSPSLLIRHLSALAAPFAASRSLVGQLKRLHLPFDMQLVSIPPPPLELTSPFPAADREAFLDAMAVRIPERPTSTGSSVRAAARKWVLERLLGTSVFDGVMSGDDGTHKGAGEHHSPVGPTATVHAEAALMAMACAFLSGRDGVIRIARGRCSDDDTDIDIDSEEREAEESRQLLARVFSAHELPIGVPTTRRCCWCCWQLRRWLNNSDPIPEDTSEEGIESAREDEHCGDDEWNSEDAQWAAVPPAPGGQSEPDAGCLTPTPNRILDPRCNTTTATSRSNDNMNIDANHDHVTSTEQPEGTTDASPVSERGPLQGAPASASSSSAAAAEGRPACPSFVLSGTDGIVHPWLPPPREFGVPVEFLRELLDQLMAVLAAVAERHVADVRS